MLLDERARVGGLGGLNDVAARGGAGRSHARDRRRHRRPTFVAPERLAK